MKLSSWNAASARRYDRSTGKRASANAFARSAPIAACAMSLVASVSTREERLSTFPATCVDARSSPLATSYIVAEIETIACVPAIRPIITSPAPAVRATLRAWSILEASVAPRGTSSVSRIASTIPGSTARGLSETLSHRAMRSATPSPRNEIVLSVPSTPNGRIATTSGRTGGDAATADLGSSRRSRRRTIIAAIAAAPAIDAPTILRTFDLTVALRSDSAFCSRLSSRAAT